MKKEYLYAGMSILLWSTIATVTKLMLGSLSSMQILFVSSLFAFLFLLIVCLFKGCLKELKEYKIKDYFDITLIGSLGLFWYNLFLYVGIDKMDASQAFIINYLWPLMSVLFACLVLKEKLTSKKIAAIILSFIGVAIVTSNGNLLTIRGNQLSGAVCCITAAVSYGLFTALNKRKNYNNYLSTMLYYFVALVISAICLIFTKESFTMGVTQTLGMLWIGIFTAAIPYTSWAIALKLGDTAKISNLAYITPFLSLIWTALILKEKITVYSIAGLLFIVLGILIQLKNNKK